MIVFTSAELREIEAAAILVRLDYQNPTVTAIRKLSLKVAELESRLNMASAKLNAVRREMDR